MGEKKFTLIELNLQGDHQFGPRAMDEALPFGRSGDAEALEEELDDESEEADESGGKGGAIGALLALAVLVALGVAAKKYTEEDEDELPEGEQPDVVVT